MIGKAALKFSREGLSLEPELWAPADGDAERLDVAGAPEFVKLEVKFPKVAWEIPVVFVPEVLSEGSGENVADAKAGIS